VGTRAWPRAPETGRNLRLYSSLRAGCSQRMLDKVGLLAFVSSPAWFSGARYLSQPSLYAASLVCARRRVRKPMSK
jgi:hypothetical protein